MSDTQGSGDPDAPRDEKRRQSKIFTREWLKIVSLVIGGTILLAVGLLQLADTIDLYPPGTGVGRWVVYGALVGIWAGIALWSWRRGA